MGTPNRKNVDTYASPYAKPMQKYPSQCEDFLSLEVGGPKPSQRNRGRSQFSTPGRHYSNVAPQYEDFLSLDVGGAQSRNHQWNHSQFSTPSKHYSKDTTQSEDFLSLEVDGVQSGKRPWNRGQFSTPVKQFNEGSPQTEDFLSLEVGGTQSKQRQWNRGRGQFSSTPAKQYCDMAPPFYQNTQHKPRGRGGYNQFRHGNNRNNFGGNTSRYGGQSEYNNQQQNRKRPYELVGQQKNQQGGINISAYLHPSMLEDPWKDLMERHKAISRSEIDIQTCPPPTELDNEDVQSNASDKTLTNND